MSTSHTITLRQLGPFARRVAASLRAGDTVWLIGPLGAGKTTFVRGIVAALGGNKAQVASPTYILQHTYAVQKRGITHVHHMDAFRLGRASDPALQHMQELMADVHGVVLVEWADRIASALPRPTGTIRIGYTRENGRVFRVSGMLARRDAPQLRRRKRP